jgi:Na+(H+)/acetate symporter ActP
MRKGVVIAFLVGWAFAVLISPRDVLGMFSRKSA